MLTVAIEDSRFVKGNPMAKISLISRRHQKKKFLETEAQRRARAREQRTATDEGSMPAEALDVLTAAAAFELLAFDEGHLIEEQDVLALHNSNRTHNVAEESFDAPAESCMDLDLTADQGHTIPALPVFSQASEENVPHTLFQLSKSQDHRAVMLHFSLHRQAIPEMISLKELCHQLKVGRRTIMRLIRWRELRCYRIAHRYRFAVEDVKHYLDRLATY
jgi:excisionase family DNA binding protein